VHLLSECHLHPRLRVTPGCRATPGISPGSLPPFPGSNMALLTGDSPLPAGVPLSSPMLAPGGSTPDMVYFGTSRPLVSPVVSFTRGTVFQPQKAIPHGGSVSLAGRLLRSLTAWRCERDKSCGS